MDERVMIVAYLPLILFGVLQFVFFCAAQGLTECAEDAKQIFPTRIRDKSNLNLFGAILLSVAGFFPFIGYYLGCFFWLAVHKKEKK